MLHRRAKPLLGTLVEIAVMCADDSSKNVPQALLDKAFTRVEKVHRLMSRHEALSELSQFNALACQEWLAVSEETMRVFIFANELSQKSAGIFDVFRTSHSPQSGCWSDLELDVPNRRLRKHAPLVADLGGIAKGYAVDCAAQVLIDEEAACGVLSGWVNAGGDARVFGEIELPLQVRHPLQASWIKDLGLIANKAVATSVLDGLTSQTVIAPTCMVADALTKIVFKTGNAQHPLLAHYGATAHIIS